MNSTSCVQCHPDCIKTLDRSFQTISALKCACLPFLYGVGVWKELLIPKSNVLDDWILYGNINC